MCSNKILAKAELILFLNKVRHSDALSWFPADVISLERYSEGDIGIRCTCQGLHRQLYWQWYRARSYRVYGSIFTLYLITPKSLFRSLHYQVQGVSGAAFAY